MSERPTDGDIPPAKKRASDRQRTKDDESDEEEETVDPGQFQRASEEVLKQRKIIKARRGVAPAAVGSAGANPFSGVGLQAPSANPFASIALVPPKEDISAATSDAAKESEKPSENEDAAAAAKEAPKEADNDGTTPKDAVAEAKPAAPVFGANSNMFSSFATSTSSAFAMTAKMGSTFGNADSAPAFSFTSTVPAAGSGFSFATSLNDAKTVDVQPVTSVFGGASGCFGSPTDKPAAPKLSEADTRTGEEDEECVFSGEGVLFEFDADKNWRERGRGEMRINLAPNHQGRLVMRQRGNLRLLMNANLWPEMAITKMEGGKAATFACLNHVTMNVEGQEGQEKSDTPEAPKLSTYAFRIKGQEKLEEFIAALELYKVGPTKAENGLEKEGRGTEQEV